MTSSAQCDPGQKQLPNYNHKYSELNRMQQVISVAADVPPFIMVLW